jgi:GT2 family glycosyltransferase
VIVTYNRKELLAQCLRAVLAQSAPVERVHVIDNASTDGTYEHLRGLGLLDDEAVAYTRLDRNAGGAGGFARGVELARADAADWIWLMDDDAEPQRDCLEHLLHAPAAREPSTAAVCPRVVGADGALQALHRGFLDPRPHPLPARAYADAAPDVGFATFVGLLVRGDVARALEPPRAEFFIWCDDYEYCLRLRERGRIRLIPASTIRHKDVAPTFWTRRARAFNRLLGWELYATPYETAWRNLCGIRNYVWMRSRHGGLSRIGFATVVAQFVLKALMYDEKPLRRIPWLLRYARDGRRGLFLNIPPGVWADKARRGEV